jgi:hypothetical protein
MRTTFRSLAAVSPLLLAGCASTQFISTWRPPDAEPATFANRKVAAVVLSTEESVRRGAELELSPLISARGALGVPAYTLVDSASLKDEEHGTAEAKAAFARAGIAGAVVMRVVGKDQEYRTTPGTVGYWGDPFYSSFWGGYWGWGWGMVYTPGTLRTDTKVYIETLIYDLAKDRLLWAGKSVTTNPSSAKALLDEVARSVAQQLRKEKLVTR